LYIPYERVCHTVAQEFRNADEKVAFNSAADHQAAQVLSPTSEYVAAGEPGVVVRNPTQDPEAGEVK